MRDDAPLGLQGAIHQARGGGVDDAAAADNAGIGKRLPGR